MTRPDCAPTDAYLAELAASLPRGRAARDLLDEIRDHLYEATAARQAAGSSREAAEREAVRELGTVAELAPDFRTAAVVCDARRQANRQLLGVLLLATWGAGAFHLLPTVHGHLTMPGPPWPVALVAVGTLLCPSLVLLGLSRTPRLWWDARWLAWLERARTVAGWLFQLGLPASCAMSAMVAYSGALSAGSPHLWLVGGAFAGHLVAGVLVPILGARHFVGAITRRQ